MKVLALALVALVSACGGSSAPLQQPVEIDGVRLVSPSELSPVGAGVVAARRAAGDAEALLVVSNYSPELGAFSGDLARAMLTDGTARAAVVTDLVAAAEAFDGVQVSFPGLASPDSVSLVEFVTEVRAALPPSARVTVAVVASTDFGGYRERGYDLQALAPAVDRFVVQTYEPAESGAPAESLGGLELFRSEIDYLTSELDADTLDLGILPSDDLEGATALARDAGLHGVVVASSVGTRD